jgi:hypothetical protein
VAGIMDFNHRKECSLRPERDLWIYAQLKRYESDIDAMRQYLDRDKERAVVIYAIRMMMLDGEKSSKILDVIEKYNPIFRIEERRRLSPYERTSFHDSGVVPGCEGNIDYLMANYEQLYLALKRDDFEETHRYIHQLKLFIRANKPDFIFEELTGSADPYMAEVTETIGRGASFIADGNTVQARAAFAEARNLLETIVLAQSPPTK